MKAYLALLSYGRPYWGQLLVAFGCLLVFNIMGAASMALLIPFLEVLFADTPATAAPAIIDGSWKDAAFGALEQFIATNGKADALLWVCLLLLAAVLLKSVFRYAAAWLIIPAEQGILLRLRLNIFDKLTRLPLAFYTHRRKGELLNLAVTDVEIIQQAVVGTIMNLMGDPVTMITYLVFMLVISWKLTLAMLIILPLTGVAIAALSRSLKRDARQGAERMDSALAVLDEFIGNMRVVKAFGAQDWEQARYSTANRGYAGYMTSFLRRGALASPVTEVLGTAVALGIAYFGGLMILGGISSLKASEFIAFLALFGQFIFPLKTLSGGLARVQKAAASYQRVQALLAQPGHATEDRPVHLPSLAFNQGISVQNVSFSYGQAGEAVLRQVSLDIPRGHTVALVGRSGGGKSTLADLVCRFYDPTDGQLLLDGTPYTQLPAASIRQLMGIVTQEGQLFHATVAENIAYGNPDASPQQIEEAARAAYAHDFITQLPQGYQTLLGERGTRLSGGQRQRIAIARALLKNPPILILDEATSALDAEHERLVQLALENLMQGRTTLVVAHRLGTIVRAQQIVVLEGGQVAEQGTHAELLSQGGLYAQLWALQNGG